SFKVNDDSLPVRLVGGVASSVIPSLVGLSGNQQATVSLGATPQPIWLASGGSYTISKSLVVLSGEKWTATGDITGNATPGVKAFQTYYHEYLLKVLYSTPHASSSVPPFTYTQLGNQTSSPVSSQGLTIWADGGTKFFVPDTQPGERWFAPSAPDGLATAANMTVAYYHQY